MSKSFGAVLLFLLARRNTGLCGATGGRALRGAPRLTSSGVPETSPSEVAEDAHFKLEQRAPVATVDELANYDTIIVGTPTRFGCIASQMAAFLDQAGGEQPHIQFATLMSS